MGGGHHLICVSRWSYETCIVFALFKIEKVGKKMKEHAWATMTCWGRTNPAHVNTNSADTPVPSPWVFLQLLFKKNIITEIIKNKWLLYFSKHPDVFKVSSKPESMVLQYCKHLFQYKLPSHWFLLSSLSYKNPIQHNQVLMTVIIRICSCLKTWKDYRFYRRLMILLEFSNFLFSEQGCNALTRDSSEGTKEASSIR